MYPAGGMRPRLLARLARILTRAARNATRRRKGGVVVTGTVEIWRKRDLMTEEEEEGMVARCGGCGCAIYSLKEYDESMEDYGGPFCLDCMDQIDAEEGVLRTIGAPEEELHHCNCSPAMN
ncbi:unnamed protein product [Cuscuta campestris]|uniref:Uncharacterized protein n=1 Tax=Cuscuta campestris TaxID=132261 RepID=A0A484LVV9_9ASTE|nr:unnamed protein product [Cuscuta campestris]